MLSDDASEFLPGLLASGTGLRVCWQASLVRPSASCATKPAENPIFLGYRAATWRKVIRASPEVAALRGLLSEHDLVTDWLVLAARAPGCLTLGENPGWDLSFLGAALSEMPFFILLAHGRAWVAPFWRPACPIPVILRTAFFFVFIIVTGGSLSDGFPH